MDTSMATVDTSGHERIRKFVLQREIFIFSSQVFDCQEHYHASY